MSHGRSCAPRAWIVTLTLCALAGCGGGGGGSNASSAVNSASGAGTGSSSSSSSGGSSSGSVANVVRVTVGPGPAAANGGTFNIPYTSVQVCVAGTSTCATIDNVLVDTGSAGLRLMASALQAAGLTLAPQADPAIAGNTIAECLPFADGYTWGAVASADIRIGGETASGASVNVIDDNGSYAATAPSACTSMANNNSLSAVSAFDANGVLGVSVFDQDCGDACANCASFRGGCAGGGDLYYSCNTSSNQCTATPVALQSQVRNPVALFPTDNNGVILQLTSVPSGGATGDSGSLTFGIGTESNNGLGSAQVLTADSLGNFTTLYKSQTLDSSFLDSGSNGLYFPDASITVCSNTASNPGASDFYCPSSTLSLSATNQGLDGSSNVVSFDIENLNSLNNSFYAAPSIGGPAAANASLGSYFDWGLPFFYGRSVYTGIEGTTAGNVTGPFYAY